MGVFPFLTPDTPSAVCPVRGGCPSMGSSSSDGGGEDLSGVHINWIHGEFQGYSDNLQIREATFKLTLDKILKTSIA